MRCGEKRKIESRRVARRLLRRLACERPREDIPLMDYRCSNCYSVHLGHDYLRLHPSKRETIKAITAPLTLIDIGLLIHDSLAQSIDQKMHHERAAA